MTQPEWMQILTSEELKDIKGHNYTGLLVEYPNALPALLASQCEKTARKIAEWGTETCHNPKHSGIVSGYRRKRFHCFECIEQLKKGVEG